LKATKISVPLPTFWLSIDDPSLNRGLKSRGWREINCLSLCGSEIDCPIVFCRRCWRLRYQKRLNWETYTFRHSVRF
jgi:hypothetical protein